MEPVPPHAESKAPGPSAARRTPKRLTAVPVLSVLGVLASFDPVATPDATESTTARSVVLNEIMFHPPEDREDLQFVEVLNAGTTAVDLSGWSLARGVEFAFPRRTVLPPGGYALVCRDLAAFRAHYGAAEPVAGVFTGRLSRRGEWLALVDPQGRVVEQVTYGDRGDWPLGADGYGSSLERICPNAPVDDPANWAASQPHPSGLAGGTPGRQNSVASEQPLPRITGVNVDTGEPGSTVTVRAEVADATGVESVTLHWAAWPGTSASDWQEVPMIRRSGDPARGGYEAGFPAPAVDGLVRFVVRARARSGAERLCPAATEPRPTFWAGPVVNTNTARIPFLKLLTGGTVERPGRSRRVRALVQGGARPPPEPRSRWRQAALYYPPGGGPVAVYDHVEVRARKGGLKVHFHDDARLEGMSGLNLIFEASPRYVLAEALGYEVFRRAGVLTPSSGHVRLFLDGEPIGYYLMVEQPGQAFLGRQGRDNDGNLYKLLWYGQGLVGQHEKKTHRNTGHQDLAAVVHGLNRASGDEQWDFIRQHFRVDEMASYYAACMCIQNWDGFFNNYFAYHDPRPGGKWELIPWDLDKTWGDYDGASPPYDWYSLPLRYGMNGDRRFRFAFFGGGPWGGEPWWRPPGYFSGPLLANPQFRSRFLARLRELCETVFTPEVLGPVIDDLEAQLEPEVILRGQLQHRDAARLLEEFRVDIQSFRDQLTHRRAFLLKELRSI